MSSIIVGTAGHIDHGKSALVRALTGVDPDRLPDAVVCYVDSTVALPLITAYALTRHEPREPKRLFEKREQFMNLLLAEYKKSKRR